MQDLILLSIVALPEIFVNGQQPVPATRYRSPLVNIISCVIEKTLKAILQNNKYYYNNQQFTVIGLLAHTEKPMQWVMRTIRCVCSTKMLLVKLA